MAESKLLEEDKDAWFFQSLKRYKNLYMFDLEWPVEAIEITDEDSICLSGTQSYSRKCEFLQMSIPPKLLPKDFEEGLCKDRDFKIISGGYASTKIKQIKLVEPVKDFVVTRQEGKNGVILFKLGNEDHATITEKGFFSIPAEQDKETSNEGLGPIDTKSGHLVGGSSDGKFLYEWVFSSTEDTLNRGNKYSVPENGNWGDIAKIKFWDDNTVAFITVKGTVCLKDLREGNNEKAAIHFHATKSSLGLGSEQEPTNSSSHPILFSFDVLPFKNKIGVVDSCGGYESSDIRFVTSKRERIILPECAEAPGVLLGKFNLEYEPKKENSNHSVNKFVVTGMNHDIVNIYKEKDSNSDSSSESEAKKPEIENSVVVDTAFVHDGHTKPVTHTIWHHNSEHLLFSTSVDSVLHAWQYIEGNNKTANS